MKKAIVISALTVLASVSAFAQGSVTFANTSASRVFLQGGTTPVPTAASGGQYAAELLSALDGSDFATATRQGLTAGFTTPAAGVFTSSPSGRTVPTTTPGGFAQFQVRVWDMRSAATYELALQDPRGFQAGASAIFRTDTADATAVPAPTPAPLGMPSFSLTIIPEPSVIGLGLLGAGALLLLRRRK